LANSLISKSLIEIAWYFNSKGSHGKCCDNLSISEFIALDKIANTVDCPIQEVGQKLGFTKSGSTRIVNRLEKKGYVSKIISSFDARICCVVITKNGIDILTKFDILYQEKFERLLVKIPESLRNQTIDIVKKLAQAIK